MSSCSASQYRLYPKQDLIPDAQGILKGESYLDVLSQGVFVHVPNTCRNQEHTRYRVDGRE